MKTQTVVKWEDEDLAIVLKEAKRLKAAGSENVFILMGKVFVPIKPTSTLLGCIMYHGKRVNWAGVRS